MKPSLLAVLLALSSAAALADVTVQDPWVRGTVPAQKTTGAFMTLTSDSDAALVGASSPLAEVTEIHAMHMEGGVMKMRAVERLELPAGKAVELKPGGYHIMLVGLKRQPNKDEAVPIILRIEGKDKSVKSVEVRAQVRALTEAGEHMKH
ncbi:MAG: copper chaperone PCu(A)C [Pseudomonadota bacterium]|jgi:copper(I)-binding protein